MSKVKGQNQNLKLKANLITNFKIPDLVSTRDGYGKGLVEAGKSNPNVVVLCADLTESTRSHWFKEEFPERFIETGIAEQNMMGIAAGLAIEGKVPFVSSYAVFNPGRNWDQMRVSVAYSKANVKICGAHAGVSVGPDGATHQALEDIAITRVLPNMTVIYPCDSIEGQKATLSAANHKGPVYLRFAKSKTPIFTTTKTPFEIGKAQVFREGKDVTIIAAGPLVYEALKAAEQLEKGIKVVNDTKVIKGIRNKKTDNLSIEVINCPTIKPLDEKTILKSVKKTKAVVTVEEHQIAGGLGGAVSELLSENLPTLMVRVGVKDRFGESGKPEELLKKFELDSDGIIKAVLDVLQIGKNKEK